MSETKKTASIAPTVQAAAESAEIHRAAVEYWRNTARSDQAAANQDRQVARSEQAAADTDTARARSKFTE